MNEETGPNNGGATGLDPQPSAYPSWVEEMQERLGGSGEELDEVRRAYAKMRDEQRRRTERLERDMELRVNHEIGDAVKELLEVVDNLDLAIQAGEQSTDVKALVEGVGMVRELFVSALMRVGLEPVKTVGEPYDPETAEAVGIEEVEDAERDNHVLLEHRAGYKFRGQLLRPANVVVGKHQGAPAPDETLSGSEEEARPDRPEEESPSVSAEAVTEEAPALDPGDDPPAGQAADASEDPPSEPDTSAESGISPADLDLDEGDREPKDPNELDWS